MVDPKATRFWQQALQSGLIDAPALDACWSRVPEAKRSPDAADRRLARQAVDAGYLTVWQAQQFLSGRAGSLRVKKYILLDRLGVGGMGRVYLARDTRLGRRVAIKLLSPDRSNNPRALARFLREAKVGAQLQHENLVRMYDEGEFNGIPFLVMELIEGKTISRLFKDHGPIPPRIAAGLARQVALGLEHAHQKGLIHRDVNPMNIMVTAEGVAKLTDLGLALDTGDGEGSLTRDGMTVGTFDYISPEQARSSRNVDTRTDIYSLGCTLYHMIAGSVPFPTPSLPEKLHAHQASEPIPLAGLVRDMPPGLEAVIARMMKKNPDDRYPTPLAAAMALEPFQGLGAFATPWEDGLRASVSAAPAVPEVHPMGTPEHDEAGSDFSLRIIPATGPDPLTASGVSAPWSSGDSAPLRSDGSQVQDTSPAPPSAGDLGDVEIDTGEDSDDDSVALPVALRASASSEFDFFDRPIEGDEGLPRDSSRDRSSRGPSRRRARSSRAINVVMYLVILVVAGGLIYRGIRRRFPATGRPGPTVERDNGLPPFPDVGGTMVRWRPTGGAFTKAEDLRTALDKVAREGGEVVLSGVGAKLVEGKAAVEISGSVRIRAEAGSGPVLVQLKGPGPFLRGAAGSSLKVEGVMFAQSCEPGEAARLIETAGDLSLGRCLIWTNRAGEGSRAIEVGGPRFSAEGCGFRGYERAVGVNIGSGSKASLTQCLFVWSKSDKSKTGWAVRAAGGSGTGERVVELDHCTVAGGGPIDVEDGFSGSSPLVVTCKRTAVLADAMLWWGLPTGEYPKAVHWKGSGNRYDIQKVAWVILPPAGFDGMPDGPDDPASWGKVFSEESLVAKSFRFTKGDSGDTEFVPRRYALADEDARGVGADPRLVGPGAAP